MFRQNSMDSNGQMYLRVKTVQLEKKKRQKAKPG